MTFINDLSARLRQAENSTNSEPMEAYMKHKFPFLGIKSPERKQLLRTAINTHKAALNRESSSIAKLLYSEAEREFHYCAIEIYARFRKKRYELADIEDLKFLITTHSHWDTVDFIAKHILGQFLTEHPSSKLGVIEAFSDDSNLWLNRSAILFQLAYKEQTDQALLFALCEQHKKSNEFFIQKAIGWALREYAKVNPSAVLNFVNSMDLKPLSRREALRRIV
jgi:3-methyladenine DNA glycosylase AlkD